MFIFLNRFKGIKRRLSVQKKFPQALLKIVVYTLSTLSFLVWLIITSVSWGSPINVWPILVGILIIYGLLTILEQFSGLEFIILRSIFVATFCVFAYYFLHVTKAMMPNEYGSIYGLEHRFYNRIQSGNWDWGEEWYRFNATKKEVYQLIDKIDNSEYKKGYPIAVKDSIERIPFNSIIGGIIDPYSKIDEPCLHWYSRDNGASGDFDLYYHEKTQTVILIMVTENI